MDPSTGKTLFQLVGFVSASGVILGSIGAWHYGRKLDQQKDIASVHREENLQATIDELAQGSRALQDKLDPFLELASSRYPDLALEAALRRLQGDLEEVRELATRDIHKPLSQSVFERTVQLLRQWRDQHPNVQLQVNVNNMAAPNVDTVVDQLSSLLGSAEIPWRFGSVASTSASVMMGLVGREPPYSLGAPLHLRDATTAFAQAIASFIETEAIIRFDGGSDSMVINLTVNGVPSFRKDGRVILR